MVRRIHRWSPLVPMTVIALFVAGCSAATDDDAGEDNDTLVLADPQPLGEYNPVDGYGELGVSPLFDGLLRPVPTSDEELPEFEPALAASDPVANDEATVWDVDLKEDVTFSDGSSFDAHDVVATYEAVLDPESASGIAATYSMIDSVTATDDHHVRFELDYPYSAFPVLLMLGIAPADSLTGGPAADSSLNQDPIGTGPYQLTDLSNDEATFEANADYWDGEPAISQFVTVNMSDDNSRAQRLEAGGIDGTVLPPALAESFSDAGEQDLVSVQSADWRGVSLPAENPFTNDEAARIAMNLAVDREGMIEDVLAGHGRPAHTPAGEVYGDGFNPEAAFDYDPDAAEAMLDDAGWELGDDGVRQRDGDRAEFTILYEAADTLRRDVATAFVSDMDDIGIDIDLEGTSWDEMDERVSDVAILLGGGDKPYDLDTQMYGALHSRSDETAPYDNPADFSIPGVDEALDDARQSLDEDERNEAYRQVQQSYVDHPTHVVFAFLDHTYVAADDDWDQGPRVMEPHAHGVAWGPWWNLAGWKK